MGEIKNQRNFIIYERVIGVEVSLGKSLKKLKSRQILEMEK